MIKDLKRPLDSKHFSAKNMKRGLALLLAATTLLTTAPTDMLTLNVKAAGVTGIIDSGGTVTESFTGATIDRAVGAGQYVKITGASIDVDVYEDEIIEGQATATWATGSATSSKATVTNPSGRARMMMEEDDEEDETPVVDPVENPVVDPTPSPEVDPVVDPTPTPDSAPVDPVVGGDPSDPVASIEDTEFNTVGAGLPTAVRNTLTVTFASPIYIEASESINITFTLTSTNETVTYYSGIAVAHTVETPSAGSITMSAANDQTTLVIDGPTKQSVTVSATSASGGAPALTVSSGLDIAGQSSTGLTTSATITAKSAGAQTVTAKYGTTTQTLIIYVVTLSAGPALTYNGSAQEMTYTLTADSTLSIGAHYKAIYSNNTNAGTATVTFTGKLDTQSATDSNPYKGLSYNTTYTIAPKTITSTMFSSAVYAIDSTGPAVTSVTGAVDTSKSLKMGEDFTATAVKTGISAGKAKYTVTITGINNYKGSFDVTNVEGVGGKTDLQDVVYAELDQDVYPYTGQDIKSYVRKNLHFKAIEDEAILTGFGVETNVIYEWSDDEGGTDITGTGLKHLTIKGTGSYTGTLDELDFEIVANDINNSDANTVINADKTTNKEKAYGYVYATLSSVGQDGEGNFEYGSTYVPPTVLLYVNTQTDNGAVADKTTAPYVALPSTAYTVKYDSTPSDIGEHTITITGNPGNGYTGQTILTYNVLGKFSSNAIVTVGGPKYTASAAKPDSGYSIAYKGAAITPPVTVTMGKTILVQGVDYDVTYTDARGVAGTCKDAGTATITLTPKSKYAGQGALDVNFTIKPKKLSGTVSITKPGQKWDTTTHELLPGEYDITPAGGVALVKEASGALYPDYKIKSYSDNVNAGTCTVTFEGMNNYQGTLTGTFNIAALNINDASVTVDYEDGENRYFKILPFTGEAQTPVPTIRISGKDVSGTGAFNFAYANNVKKGIATVTITGNGNLTGTRTEKFQITESAIAGLITSVTVGGQSAEKQADGSYKAVYSAAYTGAAKTPGVVLKSGAATLAQGVDYTLAYSNNTNAGNAVITVTGMGDYDSSTFKIYFEIKPRSIESKVYAYRKSDNSYFGDGDSVKSTERVSLSGNSYIAPGNDGTNLDLYLVFAAAGVSPKTLVEDADYVVKSITGGQCAGEDNHVIFEGKGNYEGIYDLQYTIGTKLTSANTTMLLKNPINSAEYSKTKSASVYQVEYLGAGTSAADKSKRPLPVLRYDDGINPAVDIPLNGNTKFDYVYNGSAANVDVTNYAAGSTVTVAATTTGENEEYYIPLAAPITATYTITRLSLESAQVIDQRNIDAGLSDGTTKSIQNGATSLPYIEELKEDGSDPTKVTGYKVNYVYNNTIIAVKDAFKIKYNGAYLKYGADYTLNIEEVGPKANDKTGGVSVVATGIGSYSGELKVKLIINRYDISNASGDYKIGTDVASGFYNQSAADSYTSNSFDFPNAKKDKLETAAGNDLRYLAADGYRYFVRGNDAQKRILLNVLPAVTYSKTGMTAPVLYGYDWGIPDGNGWYQTLSGEVNSASARNYDVVSTTTKKDDGGIRAYYEITTKDKENYQGTYFVSYYVVSQNVDDVIKSGELKGKITGAEVNTEGGLYYWYNGTARKPVPVVTFSGLDAPLTSGTDYTLTYTEDTDIAPGKKKIEIKMLAGNAAGLEAGSTATLLTYDIVGNIGTEWFRAHYPTSGEELDIGAGGIITEYATLKAVANNSSSSDYIYVERKESDGSWHDITDPLGIELKVYDRHNNYVTESSKNDVGYCTVRLQGTYDEATETSSGKYFYGSYPISSSTNESMQKVKIVGDLGASYIEYTFTDNPLKFKDQTRDIQFPTVKCNGYTLTRGKDYDIESIVGYNYKDAGEQKFRIKSNTTTNFFKTTTLDAKYNIVYDLTEAKITMKKEFDYDGNPVTVSAGDIEVKIGEQKLNFGTDYTIGSYEKNVNAGTASAVIQAVTDRSINSKTFTFKIKGNSLVSGWLKSGDGQTHTYDGKVWRPAGIIVNDGKRDLVENVDYEIVWDNPNSVNAGTYGFTIKGIGNFTGEITALTYTIEPEDMATLDSSRIKVTNAIYGGYNVALNNSSEYYVHPEISLVGIDASAYDVAYGTEGRTDSLGHNEGETAVGTGYQATITPKVGGNYKGTLPVNYDIEKLDVATTELVNFSDPTVEYDGKSHTPDVKVTAYKGNKSDNGTYELVKDIDYTITYRKGATLLTSVKDIGTYEFQVVGKGDSYTGASPWIQFEVVAKSIAGTDIKINDVSAADAVTLSNKAIADTDWNNGNPTPTIVVKDTNSIGGGAEVTLVEGTDYTVTLFDKNNNSSAPLSSGIGTAVITGMGNYGDTLEVPFVIGKEIKPEWIELTPTEYTYDTKEHKPTVTVKDPNVVNNLKVDKNYTLTYNGDSVAKDADLKAAGIKSITVSGINEYFGDIEKTYEMKKVTPTSNKVHVAMSLSEYDGDDPNITADADGKKYCTPYTGDDVEDNTLLSVYYYFGPSENPEWSPLDPDWILLDPENYEAYWTNNRAASIRYNEDGSLDYNTPAEVQITLTKNFNTAANVASTQFWILPYDIDVDGKTNFKAVLTTSSKGDPVMDTGVDSNGETLYYYRYTGNEIKPGVTLYMTDSEGHIIGTVPESGEKGGYTVTYYTDTTNAGIKHATVKCYGNYSGEFDLTYIIWDDFATAADDYVGTCFFDIDISEPFFTGEKEEAPVVIKHGAKVLTEGVDYTLSYGNWKGSEGAYTGGTVTIAAAPTAIWFGNSVAIDYNIETKIENLVFKSVDGTIDTTDTAKLNSIGYTGSDIRPEITVETPGGTQLERDVQYTVKWTRADGSTLLQPGEARNPGDRTYFVIVDVTGIGQKAFRYKITGCDVSKNWTATLTSTKWIYTGGERKPNVTVKTKTGDVLTKDTDYTVEYANNINPTTADKKASVTITPKDTTYNTGTLVVNYDIVPSDVPYVKVTGVGVTQATIAWPEATAPITGYLVYTDGSKVGDKGQARKIVEPSADSVTASCILDNLAQGSSTPVYVQTYLEIDTNNDGIKEIYYGTPKSNTATTKQGQSTISQAANTKNGKVYIDWVSQGGVDGYEIFYSSTADGTYIEKAYVASPLTYASVTMTKGYTYYFKVRSVKIVNGTSVYGEFSEPVVVAVTK